VTSTQKLPIVGEFRRAKPRTREMATAIRRGTYELLNVSAAIWVKYDIVVSPHSSASSCS